MEGASFASVNPVGMRSIDGCPANTVVGVYTVLEIKHMDSVCKHAILTCPLLFGDCKGFFVAYLMVQSIAGG